MGIANIIPGAYYEQDGSLVLPVVHWETGERLGEQVRTPGRHPLFTRGATAKIAAPTMHVLPTNIAATEIRPLLICEGPTDLIACVKSGALPDFNLAACWSATTLPPKGFWDNTVKAGACVYVAGDGDLAGKQFNQRIADLFGVAYVVRMPDGEDLKSLLQAENGKSVVQGLVRAATYRPLLRREIRVWDRPVKFQPTGIDIISMVESAGAQLRAKLSDGQRKYLCPLHDDRNDPSLTVDPKTSSWKCWAGCGQGGPAQFIMRMKRCDYERACEIMRQYA